MDWLHRALGGTPVSATQLRLAGFFAMGWFIMDLVQWLDWAQDEFFGAGP
jgi:hypothetical protein